MILILLLAALAGAALWVAYRFALLPTKPKVAIGIKGRVHGVIFGKIGPFMVAYSPAKAEGNIVVFGSPGSGKTASILIPTLRFFGGTFFAVDIAGDISANVDVPHKLVFEPEAPDTIPYHVFDFVDTADDKAEALEHLAFLIMPDRPAGSNDSGAADFFLREGRKLLAGALIAFYSAGMDFVEICETIVASSVFDLLDKIVAQGNPTATMFISSFSGASPQNTAGCKQAVDQKVKLFATNEAVKNALRRPGPGERFIAPRTLESHNVFVKISEPRLAQFGPLLGIITAQLLSYFAARPAEYTHNVLLSLDEFAVMGKVDNIANGLRGLRKRRVRVLYCTQSLADLDEIYGPATRRVMMDTTTFKVVLGCGDPDSMEYFSKLVGDASDDKTAAFAARIRGEKPDARPPRRIVPPADFAHLKNKLVLLSPDGHKVLRKNFYFM